MITRAVTTTTWNSSSSTLNNPDVDTYEVRQPPRHHVRASAIGIPRETDAGFWQPSNATRVERRDQWLLQARGENVSTAASVSEYDEAEGGEGGSKGEYGRVWRNGSSGQWFGGSGIGNSSGKPVDDSSRLDSSSNGTITPRNSQELTPTQTPTEGCNASSNPDDSSNLDDGSKFDDGSNLDDSINSAIAAWESPEATSIPTLTKGRHVSNSTISTLRDDQTTATHELTRCKNASRNTLQHWQTLGVTSKSSFANRSSIITPWETQTSDRAPIDNTSATTKTNTTAPTPWSTLKLRLDNTDYSVKCYNSSAETRQATKVAAEKIFLLKLINDCRATENAGALVLEDSLAAHAQSHADKLSPPAEAFIPAPPASRFAARRCQRPRDDAAGPTIADSVVTTSIAPSVSDPYAPPSRTIARIVSQPGIGALACVERWYGGKHRRHTFEIGVGVAEAYVHPDDCPCRLRVCFECLMDDGLKKVGMGRGGDGRWVVELGV